MISGISSILAVTLLGTPILLVIMFLPAILELKKPRDAGPRRIMSDFSQVLPASAPKISLLDLEEHHDLDITLKPFVKVILGNLLSIEV